MDASHYSSNELDVLVFNVISKKMNPIQWGTALFSIAVACYAIPLLLGSTPDGHHWTIVATMAPCVSLSLSCRKYRKTEMNSNEAVLGRQRESLTFVSL
jgi:hypothetical protein